MVCHALIGREKCGQGLRQSYCRQKLDQYLAGSNRQWFVLVLRHSGQGIFVTPYY